MVKLLFFIAWPVYFTGILSIRLWWRPPSKSVLKNSVMILSAISVSIYRPGITSTLASLCNLDI